MKVFFSGLILGIICTSFLFAGYIYIFFTAKENITSQPQVEQTVEENITELQDIDNSNESDSQTPDEPIESVEIEVDLPTDDLQRWEDLSPEEQREIEEKSQPIN